MPLIFMLLIVDVDDVLRLDYHNETVGLLICGIKNDRSVRYSLGLRAEHDVAHFGANFFLECSS